MRALNMKALKSIPLNGFELKGFDPGERRRFFFDTGDELIQQVGRTADFNLNATGCVPHPTCKLVLDGKIVDEWPETNPLDDAIDEYPVGV